MTAVFKEDRVEIIGGIELAIENYGSHAHASLPGRNKREGRLGREAE